MDKQRLKHILRQLVRQDDDMTMYCYMGEMIAGDRYECCSECPFTDTFVIADDLLDTEENEAGCELLRNIGAI